ncbi:MAG: 4-hydroxybenzoate octaprenyltransferase [Robiginitomaculum sp.]|nr:4-hydroxybenzoate octaprenyltransferase [Robiginitomaculum sp.]
MMTDKSDHIADAKLRNWVSNYAPKTLQPYLQLARFDRPIGFWLLAIPCWAGIALARLDQSWIWSDLKFALLFGLGAIAMRGAGCTYNDILDRDLDAKVSRTQNRPLPRGAITLRQAYWFLGLQLFVGFVVWLFLPVLAKQISLAAIILVVLYPFMKRITYWPQAWLGLTFNAGALVGYATISGEISNAAVLLYASLAFWTLGYDTIYAHQDREDDALIGIKSTARLFGKYSKIAVGLIYFICLGLLMFAGNSQANTIAEELQRQALYGGFLATGLFAFNLAGQIRLTDFNDSDQCLKSFKSNQRYGLEYVALLAIAPVLMTWLMQIQNQ